MECEIDCQTYEDDTFDDDNDVPVARFRKSKKRLVQLTNLRPGVWFQTAGVIGPPSSPTYVIEIEVDGRSFQGISKSKKKAKVMAAEYALVYLGEIDSVTERPPDPVFVPKTISDDDFSSDLIFPNKLKCSLLSDFSQAKKRKSDRHEAEPVAVADKPAAADGCGDDLPEELREFEGNHMLKQLIGKNPLTIIGEMQIDASYMLLAETDDPAHPMFAMSVTIEGETFRAAGNNKKLAKARAARKALQQLYNLEFGISDNGMPIYEGDDRIWQHYKGKLEREGVSQLLPRNNPMMLITEYFPHVKIVEGPMLDGSIFYSASLTIFDEAYSGVGTTMLDAKVNAAANAVDALGKKGVIAAREREIRAERREVNWLKQHGEIPPEIPRYDRRMFAVQRNAATKLNVIYPGLDYLEMNETKIRHADLTAFVVAVIVEGRAYVGVGKTKKEARYEAAEKALKHLRLWTDADEQNKREMLYGIDEEDPIEVVNRLRMAAGLPPCSEAWFDPENPDPENPGLAPQWNGMQAPGSWDGGFNCNFDGRGFPPPQFRGPAGPPSLFAPRGRFDNGPPGPRRGGPPRQPGFGRGFNGDSANQFNFGAGFNSESGYNQEKQNQSGTGRGFVPETTANAPRGRGNPAMMRGILRHPWNPQISSASAQMTENSTVVPPVQGPPRMPPFASPVPAQRPANHAPIMPPPRNMPPVQANPPQMTSNPMAQPPAGNMPSMQAAPVSNLAPTFNYVQQPSSAVHTPAAAPTMPWNANTNPALPGQQPSLTISNPFYQNTAAVNASPASVGVGSNPQQYGSNTPTSMGWTAPSAADYYAYYNSYLQSLGVTQANSFNYMSAESTSLATVPASNPTQADSSQNYSSQAMDYAAFYNAYYGAAGYGDQSQLYNYLYSYANSSKPS